MTEEIHIEPMSADFVLWRCLHGGPLSADSIDNWPPDDRMPWEKLRARNMPLLTGLMDAYGTCAILARDGDRIVGTLRFYPKAIVPTGEGEGFCLQQAYPAGPADGLAEKGFLPPERLEDRTLKIHCLMTGSPSRKSNPYQRKGIGGRLVRGLIEWAARHGWEAIEVTTHDDLDLLYAVTGTAGKGFWQKLGFDMVKTEPQSELCGDDEFTRAVRTQAAAAGLNPRAFTKKLTMRLDLAGRPEA